MTKVKIHTYEALANEKLATTRHAIAGLQLIYDELISLGAESVSISDIKNVVCADSNPGVIREIIIRGKSLQVGGIAIDPSFLRLPDDKIRGLARRAKKVDPGNNLAWRHYGVSDGEVVCLECAEKEIMDRYTVYGTSKAKEILSDVERLCDEINSIGKKIGMNPGHPLRDVSVWVDWDADKNQYTPSVGNITNHVR